MAKKEYITPHTDVILLVTSLLTGSREKDPTPPIVEEDHPGDFG